MKPSFLPPAREALFAMVGALVCGAACTPNNGVKAGAPELTEFIIAQPAPPGGFPPFIATTVRADTPECVSGIAGGMACLPMGKKADVADGGTQATDLPADGLCGDATARNWCTCFAGADPAVGSWNCDQFTNVAAVIAVFDRLLDTAPFDAVDAGPITDEIVTTTASLGAPIVQLLTNYSPTGAGNGLVFNQYGPFFGNLRGDGPSLFSAPQPEFPSESTVTVTVEKSKVHAKDGTTPYTGTGLLASGTLVFTMAPFSATLSPPDPMAYGFDPNAVIVAFTNFVDPAGCFTDDDPTTTDAPCPTAAHITATAGGATVATNVSSTDGAHLLVAPKGGGPWPAGATVVVTVDATTTNLVGQTIAAVTPLTFTAAP